MWRLYSIGHVVDQEQPMSEFPHDKPPEVTAGTAQWAYDPATGVDTIGANPGGTPSASRRTNGWSPTVPDQPKATDANWAIREAMKAGSWAARLASRQFDGIAEAIAATVEGEEFRVRRNAAIPFGTRTASTVKVTTEILVMRSDGQHIYLGLTDGTLMAVDVDNPTSVVWTVASPVGTQVEAMDATSDRLFVTEPGGDIASVDKATGATIDSATYTATSGVAAVVWQSLASRVIVVSNNPTVDITHWDQDLTSPTTLAALWPSTAGEFVDILSNEGDADGIVGIGTDTNTSSLELYSWTLAGGVNWSFAVGVPATGARFLAPGVEIGQDAYFLHAYDSSLDVRRLSDGVSVNTINTGTPCQGAAMIDHGLIFYINGTAGPFLRTSDWVPTDLYLEPGSAIGTPFALNNVVFDGAAFWYPPDTGQADAVVHRLDIGGGHRRYQRIAQANVTRPSYSLVHPLDGPVV
jgi:hypothetical protein